MTRQHFKCQKLYAANTFLYFIPLDNAYILFRIMCSKDVAVDLIAQPCSGPGMFYFSYLL